MCEFLVTIVEQVCIITGFFQSLVIIKTISIQKIAAAGNKERRRQVLHNFRMLRIGILQEGAVVALFTVELFRQKGMNDKVRLLETSGNLYSYYYTLGDSIDYYYGSLLPSTGYIHLFDLVKYYDGLLLQVPNRSHPDKLEEVLKQEKMLEVFKEHRRWNQILGIGTVGDFNKACNAGYATELINVSEALQEKRISQIADEILHRSQKGQPVKLILISGPSSSGKTTFSKRLSVQLMANGLRPYPISLDDYFVDREDTPKDENGNYDYESLYALDLDFFNQQLQALLNGEEVMDDGL